MIIADTDVVSAVMRQRPDQDVVQWAHSVAPRGLALSVVTVQEIEHGLARLPAGRRRADLETRWRSVLNSFGENLLAYDVAAARATARLLADAERDGHPMGLADAQIAGTCLALGADLATRNVKDFQRVAGLRVVSP